MPPYSALSLRDLLDALASPSPVPGGGAAAALAGATGASLLRMVAGLPRTRASASGVGLAETIDRLDSMRAALTALIDRDAEAYQSVMGATRFDAADTQSAGAFAAAMRAATETQLDTLRACRGALREAATIATYGAPSAHADIGVAIELLGAAARAAGGTVAANLRAIDEPAYVEQVGAEAARLASEAAAEAERALSSLEARLSR
jgi:formiminotetrahydrofolate cyclodeaminase